MSGGVVTSSTASTTATTNQVSNSGSITTQTGLSTQTISTSARKVSAQTKQVFLKNKFFVSFSHIFLNEHKILQILQKIL